MIKNIKYAIISNIGGVFLKKIFLVIFTGIMSVSVLGCKTNEANIEKSVEILASKSDDSIEKLEDSDLDGLIKDTFEDDNNIKLKKQKTEEFIKKVNDASEYFNAKDFESINPSTFEKIDTQSNIYFERVAKDEKGIEYSVIGAQFSDRYPIAIIRLSVDSEYDN